MKCIFIVLYSFKMKSLPRSSRTPTRSGLESTLRSVRHAAQLGKACCLAFSLSCGTAVEQTDYRRTPTPPAARRLSLNWKKETRRGRALQHGRQEIWCQMGVVSIEQEHSVLVCTSTTVKLLLYKVILLLLEYQYFGTCTAQLHRNKIRAKILFRVISLFSQSMYYK